MSNVVENPQSGAGRPLPKREADTFKNVVKHYEMKQYKKAVKQADSILKKYPNHGETLAMKGLTLHYMAKKEEAHVLVKEGLRNDMRSHVCWHVYGLLHRADHDYNEAIKAYKQALRVDPDNLQILRDLSMLQIQMRDLEGFAVTRNSLLSLKSSLKINWMAFALARHMNGDLEGAVKVIDIYLSTLNEESAELGRSFESGELALYKNSILAEIPDNHEAALAHLLEVEHVTVDRNAWLTSRGIYQLKLKDYDGAKESVELLFERGATENHAVHSLYMCVLLKADDALCDEALSLSGTQTLATMMPLSNDQKKLILDAYQSELGPKFPKSKAMQRIPTTMMEGEDLRKEMDFRCKKDLRKGVPSLCSELHSYLWTEKQGRFVRTRDPVEVKCHPNYILFVELIESYVASLEKGSTFPSDENEEEPSTLFWVWYLRAGLHELAGEYADGVAVVDKCLEHTPTCVDAYELKARLLKASGNIKEAVSCLDYGRDLDRQDRYINNQTTKYMLRAGMEEEALKRISMFTRHEGNPEQNLYDMQCSWYELELAACFARKEEWGRSLKKFAAVVKHFQDFQEDQFDFHSYCLRKVTLRAYVSVLRFEDVVYGQDFFCEAATGIVRIYLHLFDNPSCNDTEEPDYSNMTAAERKKAKAVARKKRKASEKKEADLKVKEAESANGNKKGNQKGGKDGNVDEDPLGKEYLKKDSLTEAKKYSAMLSKFSPQSLQTWTLQYDVAMRQSKPLLALQALFKARAMDPDGSEVFTRIVDFARKQDRFGGATEAVRTVLNEEMPVLLEKKTVDEFIKAAALKIESDSLSDLPNRLAVATALIESKIRTVQDALPLIVDGGMDSRKVSHDTCLSVQQFLKNLGAEAAAHSDGWVNAMQKRFPSLIFKQT